MSHLLCQYNTSHSDRMMLNSSMKFMKGTMQWLISLTPLLSICLLVAVMTLSNDTARQNSKRLGKISTPNLPVNYLINHF